MSRIKHPVRAIREPFGTAGLIVACVALVLALTGAAFAAGRLTSTQKKEVEKIAKKYAGKPGAPGAQGSPGSAGEKGPKGDIGVAGQTGANGTNGVSAEAVNIGPGEHGCAEGGIEVKSAKPTVYVCNGEEGSPGAPGGTGADGTSAKATSFSGNEHGCIEGGIKVESAEPTVFVCNGSPWAAGGTLPSGATETGVYNIETKDNAEQETAITSISFPIPLAATPEARFISPATGTALECPGTVEEPKAKPGFLCIYEGQTFFHKGGEKTLTFFAPMFPGTFGPGKVGAELVFQTPKPSTVGEEISNEGTWAVTG